MLARQPHKPQFTGGLEAALLTPRWRNEYMSYIPNRRIFRLRHPQ